MNQVTMVTRKDARLLLRLHSALADMLAGMDGLLTRKRPRRKAPVKRKRTTDAPPAAVQKAAAHVASAIARAKAKAAKLNLNDGEE
jgi:hypothetical protein